MADTNSDNLHQNVMSGLIVKIDSTQTKLQRNTTRLVRSKGEIETVRELTQHYFRDTRAPAIAGDLDVSALDELFSRLHELSNGASHRSSYIDILRQSKKKATESEIQYEFLLSRKGNDNAGLQSPFEMSKQEQIIIETLQKINPYFAQSYIQILRDLADKHRVSFRGVVHEMRELLRGVLNHFAPDTEVAAQDGFKLEANQSKPTRTQKMQYILNARSLSSAQIDPAKKTTQFIDVQTEILAAMPSAIYGAGSDSAHSEPKDLRNEVYRLKRYLDANLCDILEIN